ncbi:hypothetical protein EIG75_22150 [Pseudomonas syringae]|uniref:Uncharacterized protein n=1 Tax=Pseudomonas syringae TaxID=317 RepID=A0A6B2AYB2_PSESX|nr:hypothetical protein [Pseudomonas syringae]NAO33770.1 hypothetical protein [Pseudomonas syringae]NAO44349.1 hypothetical protein [Pseudomonas syringae]NAO49503.1 hypothetical protein [Pseudomonas syringae]NAO62970.1 hypothetical protein [Pseudomonas syringae]NAO68193.1 hypothetical protein [Pseudomonas syringae]
MKKIAPLLVLLVSAASQAGDYSVTTTRTPTFINGPGHSAFSRHQLRLADYPRGAANNSRLQKISWTATSFPESTGEQAKICFRRGGVHESSCIQIDPSMPGDTDQFNSLGFSYASDVLIKHQAVNGPWQSKPAGPETVTFHLTY